jgi:hypothetical protein
MSSMTEWDDSNEFRNYVQYLFDTQVQPQLPRVREHWRRMDEYEDIFGRLGHAHGLLTYISTNTTADPYEVFTPQELFRGIYDAEAGVRFHYDIAEDSGILDLFDRDYNTLIAGIHTSDLPDEEAEILTMLGFGDIAVHLPGILYMARSQAGQYSDESFRHKLTALNETLHQTGGQHRSRSLDVEESPRIRMRKPGEPEPPEQPVPPEVRKPRRWFKGVGQIVQGAAISLADIGLAAGALRLPAVQVAGLGTIASCAAGFGLISGGIGELRAE